MITRVLKFTITHDDGAVGAEIVKALMVAHILQIDREIDGDGLADVGSVSVAGGDMTWCVESRVES